MLFEKPKKEDGIRLFEIVSKCPPLDLNSKYAYHLVARHFSDTSIILRDPQKDNAPAGMISAYRLAHQPNVLFVWQAALLSQYRGRGLAVKMLEKIAGRKELSGIEYIHTTISPSNSASKRLFESFARKIKANIETSVFLEEEDFLVPRSGFDSPSPSEENQQAHEKEILYRIGPFEPSRLHSYERSIS